MTNESARQTFDCSPFFISPDSSCAASAIHLLRDAREAFVGGAIDDAALEAEVLLRHVLGITKSQLYADYDRRVAEEDNARYRHLIARRISGEPTAYITGHREFYGLDFLVDRRVLIPRPETELLVENAVLLAHSGATTFADIGTGSGAIAISLAMHAPDVRVYATDLSREALDVARLNCSRFSLESRVNLLAGDLLAPLPGPVDVIVANLPYVKEADLATVNTYGYEPRLALDGGYDGLALIRRMGIHVEGKLNSGGVMLLEIGYGQAEDVVRFLRRQFPCAGIEIMPDPGGVPRAVRVVFARRRVRP